MRAANPAFLFTAGAEYNGQAMKKRLLHGFGMAFLLASPIWLTIEKPPNYFNFAVSLLLGILLLILGLLSGPSPTRPGR